MVNAIGIQVLLSHKIYPTSICKVEHNFLGASFLHPSVMLYDEDNMSHDEDEWIFCFCLTLLIFICPLQWCSAWYIWSYALVTTYHAESYNLVLVDDCFLLYNNFKKCLGLYFLNYFDGCYALSIVILVVMKSMILFVT